MKWLVNKRNFLYQTIYNNGIKLLSNKLQSNQFFQVNFCKDAVIDNSDKNEEVKKWIDMVNFTTQRVPNSISDENFKLLIEYYSKNVNIAEKFLDYLFIKEKDCMKSKMKKLKRSGLLKEYYQLRNQTPVEGLEYSIWKNAMMGKTTKRTMIDYHESKIINAMKFGSKLVIDLQFESLMSSRELMSLCKQLLLSISSNKCHEEPFDLEFCGCDIQGDTSKTLQRFDPGVLNSITPTITDKDFLTYDRQKIIYLSPNAPNDMENFNHDAIYIIGGIVDKAKRLPVTAALAKKYKIHAERLPLERYRRFIGRKSLDLNTMMDILLELKQSGDFSKAFRHIPQRLLHHQDRVKFAYLQNLNKKPNFVNNTIESIETKIDLLRNQPLKD